MKVKNIEVLITKCELKRSFEGKYYILIEMVCWEDKSTLTVFDEDVEHFNKLKPLEKYNLDFNLANDGEYNYKLKINKIRTV